MAPSDLTVTDPMYPQGRYGDNGAVAAEPGDSDRLGHAGPPPVAPPYVPPPIKPSLSFLQCHAVARKAFDELRLAPFRRSSDPPILTSVTPEGPYTFRVGNCVDEFFPDLTEAELRTRIEAVVAPLTSQLPPAPPPEPPNAAMMPR